MDSVIGSSYSEEQRLAMELITGYREEREKILLRGDDNNTSEIIEAELKAYSWVKHWLFHCSVAQVLDLIAAEIRVMKSHINNPNPHYQAKKPIWQTRRGALTKCEELLRGLQGQLKEQSA